MGRTEPPLWAERGARTLTRLRLRGGAKAPTAEDVFSAQQRAEIDAAAAKITGSSDALAAYEIGQLECSPAVSAVVDRFIRQRNREDDRQTYPNSHVFDRGQRV